MFGSNKRIQDLEWDLKSARAEAQETKADLERTITLLKTQLAKIAVGKKVTAAEILEGLSFSEISPKDLQSLIEENKNPFVLDVRTDSEWDTAHIAGAMHIEVNTLEQRLEMLKIQKENDTPIYTICASGARSAAAASVLTSNGFSTVVNIAGGMNGFEGKTEATQIAPLDTSALKGDADLLSQVGLFLDKNVRPGLRRDGGDISFLGIKDGTVMVKLTGACGGCGSKKHTVDVGIKTMLVEKFPEITGIAEV